MNANRHLIWGIALSLLVHAALLGLPRWPGGQRPLLPHQPVPLQISLVTSKAHEDTSPREKPVVPHAQPERVEQSVAIKKKVLTKRRVPLTQAARVKPNVTATREGTAKKQEEPIPTLREKPLPPPKEKKALGSKAETPIPLPSGKITASLPSPEENVEREAAPPSPKNLLGSEGLEASLIPKGEDHPLPSRALPVVGPKYYRNPKPRYPRIARKQGYEGIVVLKVEILPNGRVGQIRVKKSSGYRMLDRSALKTVKGWKFIPAKRGEDPIGMWAEIPIRFELD
jgi:protein TonB